MKRPLKIACLGEAMIEMVAAANDSQADLGVAGDSMNTAIYLRRGLPLNHEVSFVSMIGRDALSDRIERFIAHEGVSTDLLQRHAEKLPGLYLVTTDDAGERSFAYWRSSSAARTMFTAHQGIAMEQLDGFDFIFASAISLAILPAEDRSRFFQWLEGFRAKGGQFIFDSNYRPTLWPDVETARQEISHAWSLCDIGLPSVDDEMNLFGDENEQAVLDRLRSIGVKSGVLKRAQLGPIPIAADNPAFPAFSPATTVVDTTAAGDSFNGGFLATYLDTQNLAAAAQAGHHLACHVIGHRGAIAPPQ